MKTLTIALFLAVSTSLVYAEVQLNFKDGSSLTWSKYTEENGSYCTRRAGGQICIPKKDIVSVKEVNEEFPGATVVTPQPLSAEEKEQNRKDRDNLVREQAESAACDQMAQEIHSVSGKGFAGSLYALSLIALYKCQCVNKFKNCRLVSQPAVSPPARNNISGSALSDRQSTNCSSDFDCGMGYACVKQPHSLDGVCMRTVNEVGTPTYSLPRLDSIHMKSEGDCQGITDCPVGFHCDLKYKTCVK